MYPVFLVRETGLEPVRDYHTPLKRARLPIPPLSQTGFVAFATVIIIAKLPGAVKRFAKLFPSTPGLPVSFADGLYRRKPFCFCRFVNDALHIRESE